jgi:site-specific recombinase XerD
MYSLNVCINYYINELVLSNHAKSTMEAYKGDLDQFKKFIKNKYSGIRDIEQIKVKHIAEFRRYLSVEKQFCEKTIKRKIDCLRAFFGYLYEYGYIDANPTVKLIKNKIKKEELPKYLNYKEISQITD